ncbi:hypothetical protein G6011_01266 [Alternaria panax]|uniref:Uncharacterized protein n=1 Tax=Alternaria panax TaxID=48097 RepID=A0AAD4IKH3_9PLEO|nr:hypothetical protein G6011_01266 [Alternaria panax]
MPTLKTPDMIGTISTTSKLEGRLERSKHIDDIIVLGPKVTDSLWEFHFQYLDTDYDAHNANLVTDEGIKRLARSCRILKKVSLPGSANLELGDHGFIQLLVLYQDLAHLGFLGNGVTEASFGTLVSHSEWVPNLKKLRLPERSATMAFMRGMRKFGKMRPNIPIELVSCSQSKK